MNFDHLCWSLCGTAGDGLFRSVYVEYFGNRRTKNKVGFVIQDRFHEAELPTDLGIEEWLLFYGDLCLGRRLSSDNVCPRQFM